MSSQKRFNEIISHLLILFILVSSAATIISAQDSNSPEVLRKKALELIDKDKYLEALPYLEQLVIADPEDATANFYYGFALAAKAQGITDKETARALRIRARKAFVQAKKLGSTHELLDSFIESIPIDGKVTGRFSENEAAENLMIQGESEFTQGKYDEALKLYSAALKLDPKIYSAALFAGDMYMRKGEFDNAEIWYQKAIKIDPDRETAYRYSATPLMRQEKYEQARDRYVEAFISEPYNRLATNGLIQWGNATKTDLGHPSMDIPKFEVDENGKAKSTITLNIFGGKDDPSALAWIGYTATRSEWLEKKFAKTFPDEKEYRHTLIEETEALRSVIEIAEELKGKKKKLNPQLQTLVDLDKKGLLESFILLAIPDNGIAQDHADYLINNRAKLRRYIMEYVIAKK